MQPTRARENGRDEGGIRPESLGLADFFETFVSLDVECAAERAAQTRAIAALVATGLLASVAAPMAVVAGLGIAGALVPTMAAALLLGSAALLSATGRLDAVLGALAVFAALSSALAFLLAGAWLVPGAATLSITALLSVFVLRRAALRRRARRGERATGVGRDDERAAQLLTGPLLRFDPAGRLLAVPEEAEALFGTGAGEGTSLVEHLHVLDRVAFLDAFADLRRGRGFAEIEVRLRHPGGERALSLRLAPVSAPGGEVTAVLAVARDLTQDREATRRLTQTLTRAEDASNAKSRFLAAISHELRTPLNAIIGFTDILEQEFFGGFESDRQKEYVQLIGRSGGHLLEVANGLLDLSRIEAGRYEIKPTAFSVREEMEAAAAMVRPQASLKNLVLVVQEPAEGLVFEADRRAFHQILLNLLSNAAKFTEKGCVRISARREGNRQIVEVEDTGVGIAAGDLPRIAQPFVRLENAADTPGSGLGLSLVKGLCELHHGTLSIESRIGVGTTAVATIPADCLSRLAHEEILKEKVVSLDNARKKAVLPLPHPTGRLSA